MAKEKKLSKEKTLVLENRNRQLTELNVAIERLTKRLEDLRQKQQKTDLLQSVSLGLYDEMDKLAKKAGADEVTNLALDLVNDFIRDSKTLLSEDEYVQRQKEFVPAGNNPQHRDVVVVMRQLRQGLERFAGSLNALQEKCKELLADANGVHVAVEISIDGDTDEVSPEDLEHYEVSVTDRWLRGSHDFDKRFSFDVLDRTDIPNYFKVEP
jgi:hypothetical protein